MTMKRFAIKLGLFLLPFILAVAVELFVLPIDFFTFRVWEALRVEGGSLTPGKFYPNMRVEKEEVGRYAHHTAYAVKKKVTWITDKYGYRKQNTDKKIDVVIIGDSFIVGDGLDQDQLLSEQLEERLGIGVYPVATANIKDFLDMPRFYDDPPSVVILEKLESTVQRLKKPKDKPFKREMSRIRQKLCEIPAVCFVDITQNRIAKAMMLNYIKARLSDWMGLRNFDTGSVKIFAGRPIVLRTAGDTDAEKKKNIERIVSRLIEYKRVLSERGIRFIFVPMPDKDTIYYRLADKKEKPTFLDDLAAASRKAGIETADVKLTFEKVLEKDNDLMLYIPDDSHLNENGTEIVADLLAGMINN